ncbi:MAG: hypothetical protein HZB68_02400 [Candidatus Aenigmarchaeota archaeon]|nr:hypothetical protein [Candidatus Aenigmarchaeota archaeon]
MADNERLNKVKKNVLEFTRMGEDIRTLDREDEIKKAASIMGQKIGQVYEEIERIGSPEQQAEALTELETGIEKLSKIEKEIMKKRGFNPFKRK